MEKTNVMRILEQKKIPYTPHAYDPTVTDGVSVARQINKSPDVVFKTLVTAEGLETMIVSAGKVGCQTELSPKSLAALVNAGFADITIAEET